MLLNKTKLPEGRALCDVLGMLVMAKMVVLLNVRNLESMFDIFQLGKGEGYVIKTL